MQRPELEQDKKVTPHDAIAEKTLLGALLIDNDYVPSVQSIIEPGDFYEKRHQHIFEAIVSLFDENKAADLITVADRLVSVSRLDDIGGNAYLVELTSDVYTAAKCEEYAGIIRDHSLRRRLMRVASTVFSRAQDQLGQVNDLLDHAEQRIFEIGMGRSDKGFESISSLLPVTFKKMEELPQMKGEISGLSTGFKALDEQTSGLHEGELIVVAGRPGMGKTAFVLELIDHAAVELGVPSAIFSLEMSSEQVVQRFLCSRARVSSHRLRTGRLRDAEWTNLNIAAGPLSDSPIFIDDSASLTIWDLRTRARLLKRQHNVGLVVVDYLQLMAAGGRIENRQQEISLISRSLKALAKELEIPVIACSQLSRMVETRGGEKRPILADLRESGAIEQDADVVMFVYRPAAYKVSEEEITKIRGTDEENLAEIILAKQRSGPTGTVKLTFIKEFIRFENREGIHREEPPVDAPF